jgi:hypothetical protein
MGIVITPACDLANRKAETVTFLPVISIPDYLNGIALIPDVLQVIQGQAQAVGSVVASCNSALGYELPGLLLLEHDRQLLSTERTALPAEAKKSAAIKRILAGLDFLLRLRRGERANELSNLSVIFGEKELKKMIERIVRNNFSADIHFLPADGKEPTLSSMPWHSVVLFRYPTSLPLALLAIAEDLGAANWVASLDANRSAFPSCHHLTERRPLRVSTVKPRFFSDIVARFVALQVRLGSPDFSSDSIELMTTQIRG